MTRTDNFNFILALRKPFIMYCFKMKSLDPSNYLSTSYEKPKFPGTLSTNIAHVGK